MIRAMASHRIRLPKRGGGWVPPAEGPRGWEGGGVVQEARVQDEGTDLCRRLLLLVERLADSVTLDLLADHKLELEGRGVQRGRCTSARETSSKTGRGRQGARGTHALEVGARLAARLGRDLLGPGRGGPLGGDVGGLEVLGDGRGTGRAGERLEDERRERQVLVGESLAGDRGRGSVDEGPLVVDDLDDDSELALGGALVDEDDSADLDETLEVGGSLNRLGGSAGGGTVASGRRALLGSARRVGRSAGMRAVGSGGGDGGQLLASGRAERSSGQSFGQQR